MAKDFLTSTFFLTENTKHEEHPWSRGVGKSIEERERGAGAVGETERRMRWERKSRKENVQGEGKRRKWVRE